LLKQNDDGSYTVVNAENDGDNNIYVVNDKGNRTGEIIGQTLRPYNFMNTNDKNGEFTGHVSVTFRLDQLTVSGSINFPNNSTSTKINNANSELTI